MAEKGNVHRLLLLGLGLLLLVAVGIVYIRRTETSTPPAMPWMGYGGPTAREALSPASEVAAQWQEDAHLVAVSGHLTWETGQQGYSVEWAFQFFSPSTQRLALILVSDGKARLMRDSLSPYRVHTFSLERWRVDSDRALQIWWDNGGSAVLARRPDTELVIKLNLPAEGDEPLWTVAGVFPGQGDAFTIMVNATTGAVIKP